MRDSRWYMGVKRKKRRQRVRMFPIGALAATILGTLGGVALKKLFGDRRRRRRQSIETKYC